MMSLSATTPRIKILSMSLLSVLLFTIFIPPAFSIQMAISELRERLERAENTEAVIDIAEQTIKKGEKTIETLNNQIAKLETEKAELERTQTALTSGLIGALVTAIIAIISAVSRTINSKVDRDYRRLEVVQMLSELESKGITVPPDIEKKYMGHGSHSQT